MTKERQNRFLLVGFAVFAALLYFLSSVLTPFIAGIAVAYFLDPVADKLEKWGASRLVATCLILAAFFIFVIVLLVLLLPLLQHQIVGLITRVPDLIEALREQALPLIERLQATLSAESLERLRNAAGSYAGEAIQFVTGLIKNLLSGGVALLEIVSLIFLSPLVAFYLLRDWDLIIAKLDNLLPRDLAPVIREQLGEIDKIIAGFVRGQATVCLILAVLYGIGLTAVGLEFGLLVGLGTGLISFIPYFGMTVGLVVAMAIALTQFSDWLPFVLVAAVFAVGQIIEGNFLTPKLVGDKVGLHPVWVIFALLAGGALFGFTGILLGVPAAAVIGVLVRFGTSQYLASPLYQGVGSNAGESHSGASETAPEKEET
ncbi:MAG: AI-2E family transporter [Rhodospirillales bacterium]|nr:AI-2E family transporter [Rhodospirillales bacterium]